MNELTHLRHAARRAQRRWILGQWLDRLGATAMPVFIAAAAVAALLRLGCSPDRVLAAGPGAICALAAGVAGGVIGLWLAGSWLAVLLRRPGPKAALAAWDRLAGRDEMFLSAFCFQGKSELTEGERVHLARAGRRLDEDQARLRRQWPTRLPRRAWSMPLLFLAVVLGATFWPAAGAALLPKPSPADAESLAAIGRTMLDAANQLPTTQPGEPEHNRKLEDLKASLQASADKLKQMGAQDKRDVLAELEAQARAAEALAKELGGEQDTAKLSNAMLDEMERQADTADLAEAMRAGDIDAVAKLLEALSKKLLDKNLTSQAAERLKGEFKKIDEKSTEADKQSMLGKGLADAGGDLQAGRPRDAGKSLQQTADNARRASQRENSRRQLADLSKRLRQAGLKITNQGELKRLRDQYAQEVPNLPPLQLGQLPAGQMNPDTDPMDSPGEWQLDPTASPDPTSQPEDGMPIPGELTVGDFRQGSHGQGNPGRMIRIPIPGQGQLPGMAGGGMPMPGGGGAPIPGDGNTPGDGGGMAGGPDAAGQPVQGGGVGGLHAGRGSAALGGGRTDPHKPAGAVTVTGNPAGTGPSQVRNIDAEHREQTHRSAREVALKAIQAEQESIDKEPIPLTRQEQVKAYFTALRKYFEE